MIVRRTFLVAIALVVLVLPALAQRAVIMGAGGVLTAAAPPPSYTGPGDVVASASMWGGLRAYSAAKAGNKAINVCNVADVACTDMSTNATTGALTVTTVGGSSCSVVVCTVKTLYDQTGNGNDWTQTTIANRPTLVVSCVSSLPCLSFVNADTSLQSSTSTSIGAAVSVSAVADVTFSASFTTLALFGFYVGIQLDSTDLAYLYDNGGSATFALTNNAFHAVQAMFNGDNTAIAYVDGSSSSLNTGGTATATTQSGIGINTGGGGHSPTMYLCEVGIWPSVFSSGNRSSMNSNQHTYWGF